MLKQHDLRHGVTMEIFEQQHDLERDAEATTAYVRAIGLCTGPAMRWFLAGQSPGVT